MSTPSARSAPSPRRPAPLWYPATPDPSRPPAQKTVGTKGFRRAGWLGRIAPPARAYRVREWSAPPTSRSPGPGGYLGDRFGDLGAQVGDVAQVDAQATADTCLGQLDGPAQPARRSAEELSDPMRPTQVQVRVVLPGDADAAEHLDAVLEVGLRGVDSGTRGDGRGNGQLAVIGIVRRAGGVGGGHRHLLCTG